MTDYKESSFVVMSFMNIGGNPLGNRLDFDYLKKGNLKHKEYNISYFLDEDKIRLLDFMARVDAQYNQFPQNNN